MSSIMRFKTISIFTKNIKFNQNNLKVLSFKRFNSASTQSNDDSKSKGDYFDVVICGGGMIGNAMAAALGNDSIFRNLKIALIESMPKGKEYKLPIYHSNRVVALNDQTISLFKELGNFEFIEKKRYGTVKHMHVWDSKSDASISFHNQDGSNLALIIENDLVQESLVRILSKIPNLEVFYQSKINDYEHKDQFVELKLNNGQLLRTKLLIGSDGVNSTIREKSNLPVIKWNYDQTAIVATLKLSEKTSNLTAWQRFLPTGPIALLPLDDQFSSLVWSIKNKFVKELLNIDDETFSHRINEAFVSETYKSETAYKLEEFVENSLDFARGIVPQLKEYIVDRESVGRLLPPKIEACVEKSRASYPLSFLHSNKYVANRIALIGDAVHKIHPLAGQGANLGFGDIVCLKQILSENVRNGGDLGSSLALKKYESQRQIDAYAKVIGVDLLSKLYTDYDYGIQKPLVALRTIGLSIINRIDPIKDLFKQQAIAK